MTFEKIIAVQVITQVLFITHVEILVGIVVGFWSRFGRKWPPVKNRPSKKENIMRHSSTAPTPPPCCSSTLHTSL